MEIPALVQSLDLTREDDVPSLDWLVASCEAPDSFWSALFEFVREKGPPLRSRPGKPQDL